jgi:CheY-like chemotaxis protein
MPRVPHTPEIPQTAGGRPRIVLLADDEQEFLSSLAEAIRADGHQVIETQTGAAAITVLEDRAKQHQPIPDLLVLDLMMPLMSGLEVLQRLRRSPRWARLPVLMVTGMDDPQLQARLDVPIVFKPDHHIVLGTIRRQLAGDD